MSRERGKLIFPPMGLLAVGALPVARGHEVQILDGNVTEQTVLKERIRSADPDIVGFTSFTGPMLKNALDLSHYVKQHTRARVVWGGVHASILPEQTLRNDCIDFIVRFEGEYTFMALIESLDRPEDVPGIVFRKNGAVVETPKRDLIDDLGGLPAFPWQLVDGEKYVIPWAQAQRTLPIISSRGCPFGCSFCYNKVFNKQRWRPFPVDRIKDEIDYLKDRYALDGLRLDASDQFIGPGKNGLDRAFEIVSHAGGQNLKWAAQVRIDQMSPEVLKRFDEYGCNYIFYGIETGSDRLLKQLNKRITIDDIRRVCAVTDDIGIKSAAGIMYDLPTETPEDFRQTVRLIKKLSILVRFSAVQPYPGTQVYEWAREKNTLTFPDETLGWTHFDYDNPHGLSDIPDVKKKAGLWNFKYNYLHNLKVTLKRRDWFFLTTMGKSFLEYYLKYRKNTSELNY
jgi:radical SAM superfamily enzyme YgiQ (UPF0313 family)